MLKLNLHEPNGSARSLPALFCCVCVVSLIAGSPAMCRAVSPTQAAPVSSAPPPASVTTIVIAEHRTASEAARKDIVNSLMKEAMNNVFKDSGLYTVEMFSPSMSFLKQALLTHSLESSDLDEPVKASSLHKVARLFGARSIITFHAVQEKTGIKTDVTYEELAGQDTWRQTITNSYSTPTVIGKRKLKLEEMVAVNVDAIARSLSVPSHLLDELPSRAGSDGGRMAQRLQKQAARHKRTRTPVLNCTTQSGTGTSAAQGHAPGTDDGNPTSQNSHAGRARKP